MNNYQLQKTPKVGFVQLAVIVMICRIFTLMTHIPLIRDGFSFSEQLLALAISSAATALLIIPFVMFYGRYDCGIVDRAYAGSRLWGTIAAAVYIVYLILACVTDVSEFSAFIGTRFDFGADERIIALILTIVCMYCAYCGAEGICRSGGAVMMIFLIMTAFMVGGSCEKISAEHIRCEVSAGNVMSAVYDDIAGSTELIVLCLMGKFTRDRYRCGAYLSLAGRLVIAAGITFSVILVLGDYAYICGYPFLDAGSAAGIRFLQRTDAVYMIVWSLAAVLTVSLKIFLAADILRTIFPKKLPMVLIFSAGAYILYLLGIRGSSTVMLILPALGGVGVPIWQLLRKE
ncbi:MAG: GerAB/ArcD/ProY family transporter [Oscillospiraceae bacterium]